MSSKKSLKKELKEEWKSWQFKFLVTSVILVAVSWSITLSISWIKVITLSIFITAFILSSIKGLKKESVYSKIFSFYLMILMILLWIMYLFLVIGKIKISFWVLITSMLTIMIITAAYWLSVLINSRKIWQIIPAYVGFAFGLIVLFGFIFSIVSGIPGNALIGPKENEISGPWDFVYFSSVTLYSLGYGDVYPTGKFMRLFSQLEVGFGAITHVIILGWIISEKKRL